MSDEEIDRLLTPTPGDVRRRDELLARTTAVVRRAARVRRLAKVAGVAAVFAAGVGVGWVGKPTPAAVVEREVISVPVPVIVPPEETPSPSGPLALSPSQLELEAEKADGRERAAHFYRLAGDAFLARADPANAARCYKNHLAEAGADATALAPDDSWLLVSVKNAARKETDREPNPGP